jgi:hypothetical protein
VNKEAEPKLGRLELALATSLLLSVCSLGYALTRVLEEIPAGQPAPGRLNVFYYLYASAERPHFVLLAAFSAILAAFAWRAAPNGPSGLSPAIGRVTYRSAFAVFLVAWSGSYLILGSFPLSMDEFNAVFQSRIFATGRLAAPIPDAWVSYVDAIRPTYVTFLPQERSWLSGYLPAYAALRAPFTGLGIDSLVNPLLGAASIIALTAVARRIRPDQPWYALLAPAILALSPQFLLTSMSWYAMPAHLLLNLLWLYLFVRGDRTSLALAPWLGIVAIGLHNPFPHALFAIPFLIALLIQRRWLVLSYFGVVYVLGAMVWLAWLGYALGPTNASAARDAFGLPGIWQALNQFAGASLVFSWQTPACALGVALAVVGMPYLRPIERQLAAGIMLALVFYAFFAPSQGHGWGYRYIYGSLGGIALLGSAGMIRLKQRLTFNAFRRVAVCSIALTVGLQIPLRFSTARSFTGDFRTMSNALGASRSPAVVVDASRVWYGTDLIRNDPFLKAPVLVNRARVAVSPPRDSLGVKVVETVLPAWPAAHGVPSIAPVSPSKPSE